MAQGNYQAPAGGGGIEAEISKQAMTSLITGILALVCCFPLGIWAIIAAKKTSEMIQQNGVGQEHESKATIGKILGIIGLVLGVLGIVLQVVLAVVGAGAAAVGQ